MTAVLHLDDNASRHPLRATDYLFFVVEQERLKAGVPRINLRTEVASTLLSAHFSVNTPLVQQTPPD